MQHQKYYCSFLKMILVTLNYLQHTLHKHQESLADNCAIILLCSRKISSSDLVLELYVVEGDREAILLKGTDKYGWQ